MDPDPDLTIVLLGNSGVGKSASGNTILGRVAFESKASFSPSKVAVRQEAGVVFGKRIRVVDTAGILEFEEQIKSCCEEVLQTVRPVLFLLVVKVDRFTTEQRKAVEAAIRVVGEQAFRCCFLLFTYGDSLKNTSLQDFIFMDEQSSLPEVVRDFSERFHLFNNEDRGRQQVQELLEKSGHLQVPSAGASNQRSGLDGSGVGCWTSEVFSNHVTGPGEGGSTSLQERRIVLVGPAGCGKSSAGNTLLGFHRFQPDCAFDGVRRRAESGSAEVDGVRLTVVDSAGLSGEDLSLDQLVHEIRTAMRLAEPGPHVIVLVVKIGRLSSGDSRLLRLLTRLLDASVSRHAVVLFTHGDALGGRSLRDAVQSSCCVSELVARCAGRHCVLDNTRTDRLQVERFLQLMDETVRGNWGRHCGPETLGPADRKSSPDPGRGQTLRHRLWIRLSRCLPAGPGLLRVLSAAGSALTLLMNIETQRYFY
ncbi:GTPase IMAP family member 8 [Fundulus heteroclitus]|uniref:GTPase IMAP family member 8 n=1 Tax=Fundulus heteroclitus TaxID=8078 RepID=UPI00165BA1F0|nr:GTPase IMAP family member 8 [Fundulus heteroclitus]XP_021166822.2 GTPase IMAP family member 8 [Fundulus heteroclitus]